MNIPNQQFRVDDDPNHNQLYASRVVLTQNVSAARLDPAPVAAVEAGGVPETLHVGRMREYRAHERLGVSAASGEFHRHTAVSMDGAHYGSMALTAMLLSAGLLISSTGLAQTPQPIPEIERAGDQHHLIVDGKPFLILGGQVHNSSASAPDDLEPAWTALVGLHANTAEVPLYWELIEPEPGQFDFHLIDDIIGGARRHGLRLVFLWFASWKNGAMHYTPEWVKLDARKYPRVIGPDGAAMSILSPLSQAARDADARAFAAVMRHIRSIDESNRTVIMMQVENETGLLGTDRDYSAEATPLFQGPVPGELTAYLDSHRAALSRSLRAASSEAGLRKAGNWTEVFGDLAEEAFSAWHIARYVDRVAAAGKQAYALPMYVNAWLVNPGNERAGRWPSGGPTEHVIDIWKAAAPHIDLLAPDIYSPKFFRTCADYTRPDNPLFVPEVQFAPSYAAYVFSTLATFNGLGFSPFGIDHALESGAVTTRAAEFSDSYRVLAPLVPLIAHMQYTGKLHAIVQDEDNSQVIRVGRKLAAVVRFNAPYTPDGTRGRGLIIELAPADFVIAGAGFIVSFRELEGPPRDAEYLSLEEGTLEGDRWVRTRRLNGDEAHVVSLPAKAKILRLRLLRPLR